MVLPDLRSAFSCSLLFPQFSSLVRHQHPLEGLLRHRVSKAGCLGWDSGAGTSNKFPGDTEAAGPGARTMVTQCLKDDPRHQHGLHMGTGKAWRTWAISCLFSPSKMSTSCFKQHRAPWRPGSRWYKTIPHTQHLYALSSPHLHTSSNKMPTTCQGRLPHRQLFLMSSNLSPPTYGCQIKYRMPG